MGNNYIIRAGKIVTVSSLGTIYDGAMIVKDGKIAEVGNWNTLRKKFPYLTVTDYSHYVITPSLVDCHTHLLEFAPSSLYPTALATHLLTGKSILLHALRSGITALGEQICGHPNSDFSITDYRHAVKDLPLDISFATTSISIGFSELVHFTAVTKSREVRQADLSDPRLVKEIARQNDYPGENLFINATPANFTTDDVPRAGEIIYTLEELESIVKIYHQYGKQIGVHVAGEEAIEMTLEAGVDVLHHAHGITNEQIKKANLKGTKIVATPMGGTHLEPNSPENILKLVENKIDVSIATDAYLPPYSNTDWLSFKGQSLQGPDVYMEIAHPGMKLLQENGFDENEILALLTANPASILRKGDQFGKLQQGMDANFVVTSGIPGLEITDVENLKVVYFRGDRVVDRLKG
ncbi:amidohydrolase family protein [Virgibacillus sp. NKC19-16]|uniref:amidohydrolase family protein n=1 Tax=Virgibacillus salidurans TaxID=2831673 RepID=UPI001F16E33F|nr:amidohydrolase family protein [Virgibacillus sp. NKC19-16]UJL45722.1 amidohydrolase family protein [Virgibacillus sp. NKC19-16]